MEETEGRGMEEWWPGKEGDQDCDRAVDEERSLKTVFSVIEVQITMGKETFLGDSCFLGVRECIL